MIPQAQSPKLAFAYVTTLFFAWGFVTSTIDPLVASVKGVFNLSFAEAMLTQFAWFIAYGVASLPAAAVLSRLGYSKSIIAALATMVIGCLIIPVATRMDAYPGVLLALFVIASGVTLLQVAANPLAAGLGRPEGSLFGLNFSQAFNSLGTVIGPYLGASIMLSGGIFAAAGGGEAAAGDRAESLGDINQAFLMIAAFFAVLGFFIWMVRRRVEAAAPPAESSGGIAAPWAAFRSGWALAGGAAIFLYVGSEVAIGSVLTNFLHQPDVLDRPLETAGKMVALYWLGAMIGRFIGSAALTRVKAGVLLTGAAAIAALMCLTVSQSSGAFAAYVALSIGLFNSIMFPTIFTLTLERSTASTSATSGLLCMAIVGGAVLPYIAGEIAHRTGDLHPAFYVPMLGYLGIVVFALAAARSPARAADVVAAPAGH